MSTPLTPSGHLTKRDIVMAMLDAGLSAPYPAVKAFAQRIVALHALRTQQLSSKKDTDDKTQ